MSSVEIRTAQPVDHASLIDLQTRSIRILGARFYSRREIESFLDHVGTMDDYLLGDGTYFVAEIDGVLAGCGGWTLRRPGYARHAGAAGAHAPRPTVRSVYVDPLVARLGVGRRLMGHIESVVLARGHDSAALTATLSGVPFYQALGYRGRGRSVLSLPDGERVACLAMEKRLRLADAA